MRESSDRRMKLSHTTYGVAREPGRQNDDAVRVVVRDDVAIAALADGVGSAREGGTAAHRAVEMLVDYYLARPRAWSPRRALHEFTQHINRIFFQESALRHAAPELLCTLSAVVIEGGRLYGVNVGDSPVLLARAAQHLQLSEAHVLDAPNQSHGLTRAIGLHADVEPHGFELDLEDQDLVVLCSDGVSNALSNDDLTTLLAKRPSARHLVSVALERAAVRKQSDDATAIVLDLQTRGWSHDGTRVSLEVLAELSAGMQVDGYRLKHPLGASERVWLAEQPGGPDVVLKFPPREAETDEARRDGFLRELWHATRVESDDFVRAHAPSGSVLRYYVMDYVAAPTLQEVLERGRLGVEQTIALGQFLARAGQFLLQRDHAHGDIKPENIAVLDADTHAPQFIMLDLGSSAAIYSVTSRAGTPSYLAPERFRGAPLSERTEVFAIGVTLYQCLTGRLPFGEIERFQTPRFEARARAVTPQNPLVPRWLESVVSRAVAVDPEERYQTYSELGFDLSHPTRVRPFIPRDASLFERNPLRFFKVLTLLSFAVNLFLCYQLSRH